VPRFHSLRVTEVRRETADAVSIALAVPEAARADFAYAPGQYLTLRTRLGGEEVRRSYSICSGLDDGELRIAIKRVPEGRFSAWAHEGLRPGDVIEAMPPEGRFTLAPDPAATRVYAGFAAGSGITPVLSILKTVLSREPRSRFLLFYGSRSTGQIIFRDQLEDLKDRFLDRLSVVHVLSREQQDIPLLNGRLDAAKIRALLPRMIDPARIDHAFVCGPAGMIEEVGATLAALGLPEERLHVERFTPAGGAAPAAPARVATDAPAFAIAAVTVDGVRTEVPVAEGEPILDAALRAGLDLPYSCRGGMCSTCRARLTEGEVEMEVNYALEPWETEAGYVLTCQAHARTRRVAVDYDHV
jgi:ring-1,2-phenylacetyl-CoA epoxidase subunit PaaE